MEYLWTENHFGKDAADFERWQNSKYWNSSHHLYEKPIVRHDFDDSSEFDGNAYDKGGWVLYMLRNQLGEKAFFAGLQHYLEDESRKERDDLRPGESYRRIHAYER